jgi:hypothetical protein
MRDVVYFCCTSLICRPRTVAGDLSASLAFSKWFAAKVSNSSATLGSVHVLASLMQRSAICRWSSEISIHIEWQRP